MHIAAYYAFLGAIVLAVILVLLTTFPVLCPFYFSVSILLTPVFSIAAIVVVPVLTIVAIIFSPILIPITIVALLPYCICCCCCVISVNYITRRRRPKGWQEKMKTREFKSPSPNKRSGFQDNVTTKKLSS